jgi:hypothetical protein
LCPEAASARAPGQVLFVGWITSSFWPAKTQWKEVGSPTSKEYEQYRRYLKKKRVFVSYFFMDEHTPFPKKIKIKNWQKK